MFKYKLILQVLKSKSYLREKLLKEESHVKRKKNKFCKETLLKLLLTQLHT